jgi:hypothetical protein
MNHDWESILASKRAYHRAQAALPVAEKFRLLRLLRDRSLLLREAGARYLAIQNEQIRSTASDDTEKPAER